MEYDTDNYTLYIAAELTKDVNQVYVGVRSSNGLYIRSYRYY